MSVDLIFFEVENSLKIMVGRQRKRERKENLEFFKVLSALSQKQLQVLVKYLNSDGINLIGTLVYNLTQYRNPLNEEGEEKLKKCIDENFKLINHLIKPTNSYRVKRKKLQNQNGGALLTTLLTVGIPILADIIANAVR